MAWLPGLALGQAYPLCPGAEWNSNIGTPSPAAIDRVSPGTATSKAMEQSSKGTGKTLNLESSKQIQSQSIASLKPSLGAKSDLMAALSRKFENPGIIARLDAASASLHPLHPQEQNAVIKEALSDFPSIKAPLIDIDPAIVEERLKIITVNAQIAGLQKTLDPRTLAAYLDSPVTSMSNAERLNKFSDTSFRALSMRLMPLIKANGPLGLKLGNETVDMVGAGEHVRPGGLELVPSPQPVAFGTLPSGDFCVRPADKSDWKLDPESKKIGRIWDPKGFRDVGLLIWRTKDGNGRVGNPKICSFVRVGGIYAVTAAHCVIESGAGLPVRKRDYTSPDIEAVALLPRLNATDPNPMRCFDSPERCGYFVSRLRAGPELPTSISWASSLSGPTPDVALLALPFEADAPAATTGVAASSAGIERLTLAGYGLANAIGAYDWGSLLVGWQQHPPQLDTTNLIWSVDIDNGAAGGCGGDSGAIHRT